MFMQGRIGRTFLVLLFLCAMVGAQSASFASEHSHQHSSQHCCGLCHVGPLPLLQPASAAAFAPAVTVALLAAPLDCDLRYDVLLTAGSSRAPPSLSI
jgi:hypothetical protein